MKRLSIERVAQQLAKQQGNISAVARAFAVSRTAVRLFIDKRPELKQALIDAREEMKDNAESALSLCIARGEGWAVCFALKCLAKDRGYIERTEHTG